MFLYDWSSRTITISSMNKVNVFLLGTYSVLLLIGVDNQALPNGDVNVRQ